MKRNGNFKRCANRLLRPPRDADKHLLFSILTAELNAVVAPGHANAMLVLQLDEMARETWLTGSQMPPWHFSTGRRIYGLAGCGERRKTRR